MATAAATGADVVSTARRYLGAPYVWGGESPAAGFDCSGLVQYVYGQLGLRLPRVSRDQAGAGRPVPLADIAPGDLVFSDWEGTPNSHVAIYAGDGRLIEAPQTGQRVHEIPFGPGYRAHVDQVRRVVGAGSGIGIGGSGPGGPAGADPSRFGVGDLPGVDAAASALSGLSSVIGRIASFFDALLWLTRPDNIRRVLIGTAGAVFVGVGIAFLIRAAG